MKSYRKEEGIFQMGTLFCIESNISTCMYFMSSLMLLKLSVKQTNRDILKWMTYHFCELVRVSTSTVVVMLCCIVRDGVILPCLTVTCSVFPFFSPCGWTKQKQVWQVHHPQAAQVWVSWSLFCWKKLLALNFLPRINIFFWCFYLSRRKSVWFLIGAAHCFNPFRTK